MFRHYCSQGVDSGIFSRALQINLSQKLRLKILLTKLSSSPYSKSEREASLFLCHVILELKHLTKGNANTHNIVQLTLPK